MKIIIVLCIVALIITTGLAVFFFTRYIDARNNPQAISQETTQRLVEKVGSLYALPQDEEPTVAEVSDKEKIKQQAFFKSAENGDFILIYPQAKIAILYRESENKLINVGPIAIDEENQAADNEETEPAAPTESDAVTP